MATFVPQEIEEYCVSKSLLPSALCQEIAEYTKANVPKSQMLIGPLEASLLGMMIRSVRAKRILEVGCFMGYSAMAMAEQLPEGGELITLDINEQTTLLAQTFWRKSSHGSKIRSIIGPALETMEGLKGPFDFVFIDADKQNYTAYLKRSLELLSPTGMIALDNCLYDGEVLNSKAEGEALEGIRRVNAFLESSDLPRVLLPIRDGIFLVQPPKRA